MDYELDKLGFFKENKYYPHPKQLILHNSEKRFRVLACGARWGKTKAAANEAMAAMLKPDTRGWVVSKSYDLADKVFREVYWGWKKIRSSFVHPESSLSKKYLKLCNGAECIAKSADNPESLLGEALDWCINDEAAVQKPSIWHEFLRPRLSDRNGWALFTSTPKGKGWFWHLYLKGKNSKENPDYFSMEGPVFDNPYIDLKSIGERKDWTQRGWEQEVQGKFIDDTGSVFGNIRKLITLQGFEEPKENQIYAIGVDWARHVDYTVFTVLDSDGRLVAWNKLGHEPWSIQKAKLIGLSRKYNNATCYMDSSGPGDPVVEELAETGLPTVAVKTAQQTPMLISSLVLAFENNKISMPEILELIHELEVYSSKKNPSGTMHYGAPEGFHDDTVISLALAWRGVNSGQFHVPTKGF